MTCHVLTCEPPTRFVWCVSDPEYSSSTWSYDLALDPVDPTGTVVRQEFRHGPGRSMVRLMIQEGADAAMTIGWREQMLAADMAAVLTAADALLSADAPRDSARD